MNRLVKGMREARRVWWAAVGVAAGCWMLVPGANAKTYTLTSPRQQVVGQNHSVVTVYADSLYSLARKYRIPSPQLIRDNPKVDAWVPGAGKTVLIPGRIILPPGPHHGVVVNVTEQRLYYYPAHRRGQPSQVMIFPVSVGMDDWRTPVTHTHVIAKIRHPVWYVPISIFKQHLKEGDPVPHVVRPGPKDPLGDFALRLAAGDGEYMIHGTNLPIAVGMPVTHGCVRLYPNDIAALFKVVRVGEPVHIVDDPVKVAWTGGQLLMQAFPDVLKASKSPPTVAEFSRAAQDAVGHASVAIDWAAVRQALKQANGIVTVVGQTANLSAKNQDGPAAL